MGGTLGVEFLQGRQLATGGVSGLGCGVRGDGWRFGARVWRASAPYQAACSQNQEPSQPALEPPRTFSLRSAPFFQVPNSD